MELLNKVVKYFTNLLPNDTTKTAVLTQDTDDKGAKVAAIAVALHHHTLQNNDIRAKVAAIAVALHHQKIENSQHNNSFAGLASLVAAIHHHKKTKQE